MNNNNFLLSYYFFTYLLSCSAIVLSLMYYLIKKNKESILYMITISSYTLSILVAFLDFFFDNVINNYSDTLIIISILIRTLFICISVFTLPAFFSFYLTGIQRKIDKIILLLISILAFLVELLIIMLFEESKSLESLKIYFYNVIGFIIVFSYIYTFFIILKNKSKIDTVSKKFLVRGALWWGIICIPVMTIQYLRPVFKIPYYIYFEPILFFFWNVYFFIYFVKFYYLHIGEKTLSINGFCKKFNISGKEKEIISCIIKGLLNKEIAVELGIVETTVKKHVYNIFKKTNISSRVDLVNLIKK